MFYLFEDSEDVMDTGEIILYKPQDESVAIDVLVDRETVWLTQGQMGKLFGKTAMSQGM